MLGHLGTLLEGPGRHLETDTRLGNTDLEFTRVKKATCKRNQKTIEQQLFFIDFWRQGASEECAKLARWRFGCGPGSHLADHGRHLVANKAAKSQRHPFLNPSWAHLGPTSKHLGPHVVSRWASCVDVACCFLKTLILLCVSGIEVGFVR